MPGVHTYALPISLEARTKRSVISKMVALASSTGLLWDPDKMEQAVRAREELQTTALDTGVALLHPRRPQSTILAEPLLALGVTSQGIPFGGGRQLTDVYYSEGISLGEPQDPEFEGYDKEGLIELIEKLIEDYDNK